MEPMLVERKRPDLGSLKYPYYAGPKLDGFRALVRRKTLLGRKLEPIPNAFVAKRFSCSELEGLDGELILGDPTDPQVFNKTSQALRTESGEPDVKFWVFDIWNSKLPYEKRLADLLVRAADWSEHVKLVPSVLLQNADDVRVYEGAILELGYEGVILRSPGGLYKYGRTTMREATMFKLKPFVDGEFMLTDVEEEMENLNVATKNKLGRTKRSSHQENKVGKGRAGTLVGYDLETRQPVRIPVSAIKHEDRERIWRDRRRMIDSGTAIGKYKHLPIGVKEKRRSPVFVGWRPQWDIS